MNLEKCYIELGGNYAEVKTRLPDDRLIEKFLVKFLSDGSFAALSESVSAGDAKGAFLAVHSLKGVCANLSFTRLAESASELTEILRPAGEQMPQGAAEAFKKTEKDYENTVAAIKKHLTA